MQGSSYQISRALLLDEGAGLAGMSPDNLLTAFDEGMPIGQGEMAVGTYNRSTDLHYELQDPSYYVRERRFFCVGRVFSVTMNDGGKNPSTRPTTTDYYFSESIVVPTYGKRAVRLNIRYFIVIQNEPEY